ncbi:hypothetical protein SUGI_0422500 [Cryptomeria japonica]|uniref:VQ motif-containing protein 25 n=1 Tax=Cryptomeria japonica TaxID=3369 RepID=UPI002408CB1B|nr:VQ motif-containing protein 25 [Cryptomeria japonica]GLJ22446.1 hypothetical protein SUGI_0422500 [Cryptomeria japonica]
MEPSTRNQLRSSSNTMLGTSNSSHVISKFNAHAPCGTPPTIQNTKMVAPTIRIVHIFPPKIIKTDPANFRALVQKLTGRHSHSPSKKPKKKKLRSPVMNPPPMAGLSEDDSFCSKQTECPFYQNPVAEIKTESFGCDGINLCDNFAGFFGGFAEFDMFGSILPENPTIGPHADHRSGIFMPLESGGFSHFS